ncbi:unnamed protein product [marine sediment metagenome]|uniref:Uncharacterized protein n=1 Tax=marine sediment metagenome TaxID=412755 RepID=X0TGB9_9ZZZZ
MTTVLIVAAASLVVMGIVYFLAKGWTRTAAKGGSDKEARKRLEEMAKREKEADKIKSGSVPIDLSAQLERLRNRLGRNRD